MMPRLSALTLAKLCLSFAVGCMGLTSIAITLGAFAA